MDVEVGKHRTILDYVIARSEATRQSHCFLKSVGLLHFVRNDSAIWMITIKKYAKKQSSFGYSIISKIPTFGNYFPCPNLTPFL
jgi:hypothetical protein